MKQLIPKQSAAIMAGLSFLAALLLAVCFGSVSARAASADAALTFSDTAITASGDTAGIEIDGTDLTITAAGTYELTGSCADGSVTVKKGTAGVTLILNGLTLTSTDSAALSCNKDTQVTLQVQGTNTLTDAEDIANEASDDFDGAAVKVKSGASLDITGTGTLTVNGDCKNGVKGGALATITLDSGTLIVNAENNGLACDNAIVINGGSLTVTAGNDGVKAEPDEDDADSAGTVTVTGGTLKIISTGDSVQSAGDMTIAGGTFTIQSGDDAFKSAKDLTVTGGTFRISAADDGMSADYVLTVGTEGAASGPDITITKCTEGLEGATVNLYAGKAVITASDDGVNAANKDLTGYTYAIKVTGGDWYVNANGDAMDSNGNITVSGGEIELYGSPNGGNNALDYEGTCTVSGGILFTVDCSTMNQVPSYGTYVVFGRTDGGMGGSPGGGPNGPDMSQMPQPGENGEMPEPPDGMTPTDFGADGQQQGQNGQRGQRPGQSGDPTGTSDGQMPTPPDGMTPPDFSGGNGGFPGGSVDTSTINIHSGSRIEIKDSSGNTRYSATGVKTANCVMLSSDALTAGETCTLYVDGEAVAAAEAAEGTGQGGFSPGGQMPGQPDGMNGQQPEQQGQQPQQVQSSGYSDVSDTAWYQSAVRYVTEKNMMNGTGGGRFSPNDETTRAMVVTILYRMEGSPEAGDSSYSDVSAGAWYADAVAWAEANDIVKGTGSGTFSPAAPITRQQLAAILCRYAQYKGYDLDQTADLTVFTDGGEVQSYARTAMEWACGTKLIQGVNSNTLGPSEGATRAQVAAILQRLCETVAK